MNTPSNRLNWTLYRAGFMHLYQVMALELFYRVHSDRASDLADRCAERTWV